MKNIILISLLLISIQSHANLTTGTYEVPVENSEIKAASLFKLSKVSIHQNGDHLNLKYTMPTELTGTKNIIELDGINKDGPTSVFYKNNQFDCLSNETYLTCKVQYQDLDINQALAEKNLFQKFQGNNLQDRMTVQKIFSTDPIGVIKIKLH